MLTREKEECPVFQDRPADGESVVLVAHLVFRRSIRKRRVGSEKLIAVEVIRGAVKLVGSGFDDQVRRTSRVASRLRAGSGHEGEILNRIHRQNDAGDSRDTALVYGGNIPP